VREVCGIQAQDVPAAALAVRARTSGLTPADIERARVAERSIVRAWFMRGTLHWTAAEDVRWLLALLGPPLIAANRSRRAELGLDDEACARGVRLIRDALASRGPLTRAELAAQLAPHDVPTEGQAMPHLLYVAALEGVICHGPERGREPTYLLLDDWLTYREEALPREAALAKLARRYLSAYGPARPEDLSSWSGLVLTDARAAWRLIEKELSEVGVAGPSAWVLKARVAWLDEAMASPMPVVSLLGAFDTYLLGHKSRDLVAAPEHQKRINKGGGWVLPTLLADGQAVATWSAKKSKRGLGIIVTPFEGELSDEVELGLAAEVRDVGRFLGVEATVSVRPPPASS
jgi:hypothetical protein